MKESKKVKIFLQLMKGTRIANVLAGYAVIFMLAAAVMTLAEPSIQRYRDGLWYAFVSSSTIGFGDFAAGTPVGRIATVLLYICTVLVLALITAFFTQFFIEAVKARNDESVALFAHDLEHLEELPRERLAELSGKIREHRS